MGLLLTVTLMLGLRRGESLGLRWKDLDLEGKTLRVNNQVQRVGSELKESKPKTEESNRTLELPTSLVGRLKEHKREQLTRKMKLGAEWQDRGLVFTSAVGNPVDPRNVKGHLDRILSKRLCGSCRVYSRPGTKCQNCGESIENQPPAFQHLRVHDLRHLYATLSLAQGTPLKVVSDNLGHTKISVTADVYTSVLPSLKRDAANLMDTLIGTGTEN